MSRVLIIDDNAVDRLLLKTILLKAGIDTVQEAENGQVGTLKSKTAATIQQDFDVVYVDLNMPVMDGIQTVRVLRRASETKWALIFMLTGSSEPKNVKEALEAGVDDFIVKPLDANVITEKLLKHLRDRKRLTK